MPQPELISAQTKRRLVKSKDEVFVCRVMTGWLPVTHFLAGFVWITIGGDGVISLLSKVPEV